MTSNPTKVTPALVKQGPYLSERNIPLIAQEVCSFKRPIVTMENYCKWYGVWILHPDGTTENIDPDILYEIEKEDGGVLMGDHNYHPRLLYKVAKRLNGTVDPRAIEMVTGRWVKEVMDGELPGYGLTYIKGSY